MNLTPRQQQALEDICDAFSPAGNGMPSARQLGVAQAVLSAVALNPRESERNQLATLLSLWDTPALGALGGAGPRRFSSLDQAQRERVLLSWADSRVPQRRAVFEALRKGALLFYYTLSGGEGRRNPAWDAIGYDGPLGKLDSAPPKALQMTPVQRDERLTCDVVIVGSGAGGGAAAAELAAAQPEAAPGGGRVRGLRRGAEAVGGSDAGALLRPAPRPRRRVRAEVRDGGEPSPPVLGLRPLARIPGALRPDGGPVEHRADRRAPARP